MPASTFQDQTHSEPDPASLSFVPPPSRDVVIDVRDKVCIGPSTRQSCKKPAAKFSVPFVLSGSRLPIGSSGQLGHSTGLNTRRCPACSQAFGILSSRRSFHFRSLTQRSGFRSLAPARGLVGAYWVLRCCVPQAFLPLDSRRSSVPFHFSFSKFSSSASRPYT